jgi:DNA-binding SARP family transcriptional activator
LFLLALAGSDGIHAEQLAEQLWPDARVDHKHLLARVRTLLWDARDGLGADSWRLERVGPVVRLDLTGVPFDLADSRTAARQALTSPDPSTAPTIVQQLQRPLLTRWAYEEWVLEQVTENQRLAEQVHRAGTRGKA